MDGTELSTLTVAELKVLLKEAGLSVSGRKADLITRLESADEEDVMILDEGDDEPQIEAEVFEPILDVEEFEDDEVLEAEIFEAEVIQAAPIRESDPVKGPPWWQDGTNIATILVVALLAAAGGWWYLAENAVVYEVAPSRYGDNLQFKVQNGLLLAEGDEMVEYLRDATGGKLDQVCGELRIEFSGDGSASITEGTLSDLKDPGDTHLRGAVMANGKYGQIWNAVESNLRYDLTADMSGFTWSAIDSDNCSPNTDWSRNNNNIDISVTQWTELTESIPLRTDTTIDFRDSDDVHSSAAITLFGSIGDSFGGSSTVTDLINGVLMPLHPVDLYDVFGLTVLEEGLTGTHGKWHWRIGSTGTVAGQDAIQVFMDHAEIRKCLGQASIEMWVIPEQPLPARQSVDIVLDGRGDGTCSSATSLAVDYAFPDGTFTSRYTLEQTAFKRGDDLLDWRGIYATRPMGSGEPDSNGQVPWNAGTHMWDNSTMRAFTLEQAVACVVTDAENFSLATTALNGNGYVFRAQDDRSGNTPVWNLSIISSTDARWVRVAWPGGEGCLNSGDGQIASEDRPEHQRDQIPPTHLLSTIEERMTSASLYPDLHPQVMSGGALRDDAQVGYTLIVPESNALTELISGDLLDGKVTVHIERSWTTGNEDHTLRAAMDGEKGRMGGWIIVTTPSE